MKITGPASCRMLLAGVAAATLAGCYREERPLPTPPSSTVAADSLRMSEIRPGKPEPVTAQKNPYEENAYAVSQGQKLFKQYNCNGCHSQGGGGMGPALMDDKWIYGPQPENIFATIKQGRPNGMPSFGGRIPDDQIWQLVAYVRSLSGQLGRSVTSARTDSLQGKLPAVPDKEQPKPTGPAKSSEQ